MQLNLGAKIRQLRHRDGRTQEALAEFPQNERLLIALADTLPKAVEYAGRMPELKNCRELMLAGAADGKEEARYIGDFLLKAAAEFSTQMVYALVVNLHHYDSDLPIEKLKGVIALFHLLCDDGNLGIYHGNLVELYLYLSRIQWERGYHDDAFASLNLALHHARRLESVSDGMEHRYTAPLVSFVTYRAEKRSIARNLPNDWPMWCYPDYSRTADEIKADPRWNEWVKNTQK